MKYCTYNIISYLSIDKDTERANVLIGDLSKLLTVSNKNILSSSVSHPSPVQATLQSSTSLQSSSSSYTDHAAKETISQYFTIKNSEPDAVLMTVTVR